MPTNAIIRNANVSADRQSNDNAGGFAKHDRRDADFGGLTPEVKQYKPNNISVGSRTPWGEADYHVNYAPGIDSVSTPGHGGIKLSADRNKEVHPAWRQPNGWYEEDCDWAIAAYTFPHETRPTKRTGYTRDFSFEEHLENISDSLRRWRPYEWEKITGETIPFGVSHTKDEHEFEKNHAGKFLSRSAKTLDDGRIEVQATKASTDEKALFILTQEQYDRAREEARALNSQFTFVVDDDNAERGVHPDDRPKTPTRKYTNPPSADGATAAARARIEKDLNKRWRMNDGGVRSLRQMIENGEISGKSCYAEGTSYKYSLKMQANVEESTYPVIPVSKATWDAFEAPDERDAWRKAVDVRAIAEAKLNKEFGHRLNVDIRGEELARYRKLQADITAAGEAVQAAWAGRDR